MDRNGRSVFPALHRNEAFRTPGMQCGQIVAQDIHSADMAQSTSGLDFSIHDRAPLSLAAGHTTDDLFGCRMETRSIVLRLPPDLTGYDLMSDCGSLNLWFVLDRSALSRGQRGDKMRSRLGPGHGHQCCRWYPRLNLGPCLRRLLRTWHRYRYCLRCRLWNSRLLRRLFRGQFRNSHRHRVRDLVRSRTRRLPGARRYIGVHERNNDGNGRS